MTVFKTFIKVLKKYKAPIILYTVLLVSIGGMNMQTSDGGTTFVASEPNILIINNDKNSKVTKNLVDYIENHSKKVKVEKNEEAIDDALFYRELNYVIYIPKNYGEDFLKGENPQIKIKGAGDYQASYAEMLLSRYIKVANVYVTDSVNEKEFLKNVNNTLKKEPKTTMISKLDTNSISKATHYFNFLSYSFLAGCIYVICLILSSFKKEPINKRTIISSTDYKKHNRDLLLSNCVFSFALWVAYMILGIIILGDIMFTTQGLIYVFNSIIYAVCAASIGFLIATLVSNPNAINGLVQVVALGSSFLCGVFVPIEFLPNSVVKVAHIFPTYWYVQTNELLKEIEVFNLDTMKPIFTNTLIIIIFIGVFILLANIISRQKRKIG